MYSSGREALDVSEGLPILRSILPGATDADLAELADVTIVNQPELTKGEETGFEFVHKSFSEYFAAEQIAIGVERTCFQSEQWGADEKTWAMSVHDAVHLLGSLFAIRLLTAEVQEMLEPMLDDFKAFAGGPDSNAGVKDVRALIAGLERKLQRVEGLLIEFASGGLLEVIGSAAKASKVATNPLESYGNFVSALLFLAVALVHRLGRLDSDSKRRVRLTASALVRMIHIVLGGDIQIDLSYASRGLTDIDVGGAQEKPESIELAFPPLPPYLLDGVRGLSLPLDDAIAALESEVMALQLQNALAEFSWRLDGTDPMERNRYVRFDFGLRRGARSVDYLQRITSRRRGSHRYEEMRFLERRMLQALDELHQRGGFDAPRPLIDEVVFRLRELASSAPIDVMPRHEIMERFELILHRLMDMTKRSPRQTQSRGKGKET
jgi:hypothetical protein